MLGQKLSKNVYIAEICWIVQ